MIDRRMTELVDEATEGIEEAVQEAEEGIDLFTSLIQLRAAIERREER